MTMFGAPLGARLGSGHQGSEAARVVPILPWKPCVSVSHNSAMCAPSPQLFLLLGFQTVLTGVVVVESSFERDC